jgi:uncharacterized protein
MRKPSGFSVQGSGHGCRRPAIRLGHFAGAAVCGLFGVALLAAEVPDKAPPLNPGQVRLGGWLGKRIDANAANRLAKVDLEGRLRPFQNPTERDGWSGEHIGKWLHAASLAWQYNHDDATRKRLDDAVTRLAACQAADGYLGTYGPQWHWGGWDVWTHKYNLIWLLACYDATGDKRALEAARKIGDLMAATFGADKRDIIQSGTHVGMAATSVLEPVALLYRTTKDPKYLELARYIVRSYDAPNGPKIVRTLTDAKSVAKTANRKAYEMMSNLVGLCELYRATGDDTYLRPCLNAYDDIVENQMYLTGGTSLGEHFQDPHHLPNTGAVSENCAQVTWLQLCAQLLRITGEVKYADTLERIVYNHLLASQKPSGDALCYFTPLAGRKPYDGGMNCCTSSGPRGIALVPTLAYSLAPGTVYVNFYGPSELDAKVAGTPLRIVQKTDYPIGGKVDLAIEPQQAARFELALRVPGWTKSHKASLNGEPLKTEAQPGQYLRIAREWKKGDRIELELAMPAVLVRGTHTNEGMVAVRRGPLVLAFDSQLNPGMAPTQVSPIAAADDSVAVSLVSDPKAAVAHAFQAEAFVPAVEGERVVLKKAPIVLTSFAEAGQSGSNFAVWLPSPERIQKTSNSPLLYGRESWSRPGNIEGSIADGDVSTHRVTFDGHKQAEDWFAVERPTPARIDTIVYAHGRVYHDGGWWDASKGKPRLQIKKTPAGLWQDVATIDSYPATTATDAKNLPDGKSFTVKVVPTEVVGIRAVGVPACGDNPQQSFVSCAELQGYLEKSKP